MPYADDALLMDRKWQVYKETGCAEARADLLRHYLYLVNVCAHRMDVRRYPGIQWDDVVSAGLSGLLRAIDRFEIDSSAPFERYALATIRISILEMLRREDWVPRRARDRFRAVQVAAQRLEFKYGRSATHCEIAAELGTSEEDIAHTYAQQRVGRLASLDDPSTSPAAFCDNSDLASALASRMMTDAVAECVRALSERERRVLSMYYYEEVPFSEIARSFGISESRAYQVHGTAIRRLRSALSRSTGAMLH